jgi:hypothetical protein
MVEEPAPKNENRKILIYHFNDKVKECDFYSSVTFYKEEIKNIKKFLKEKADAYAQKWGGELIEILELNIDENTGYEIDLKLNPKANMRARLFFKEGRYYEVVVMLPPDKKNSAEVNQVLNSFKIE